MHMLKAQERLCVAERHFVLASDRWKRRPDEVTRLAAVVALETVREAERECRRAAMPPITWRHWCVLTGALLVLLVVLGGL